MHIYMSWLFMKVRYCLKHCGVGVVARMVLMAVLKGDNCQKSFENKLMLRFGKKMPVKLS